MNSSAQNNGRPTAILHAFSWCGRTKFHSVGHLSHRTLRNIPWDADVVRSMVLPSPNRHPRDQKWKRTRAIYIANWSKKAVLYLQLTGSIGRTVIARRATCTYTCVYRRLEARECGLLCGYAAPFVQLTRKEKITGIAGGASSLVHE